MPNQRGAVGSSHLALAGGGGAFHGPRLPNLRSNGRSEEVIKSSERVDPKAAFWLNAGSRSG